VRSRRIGSRLILTLAGVVIDLRWAPVDWTMCGIVGRFHSLRKTTSSDVFARMRNGEIGQ